GVLRIAVHDVVILDEGESVLMADLVSNFHEHQRAAASVLPRHVDDARDALDAIADTERRMYLHAPAGVHAAREPHRRKELAAAGVAVHVQLGLTMPR